VSRPPGEQASAQALLLGIDFYQTRLRSPMKKGMGVRCRFSPTCSRYATASIRRYGAGRGLARSVWRIDPP
jgi:putative component of membrane protein insertase Oxa1/YidC/SpoIIIJ protein YidD